MSVFRADPQDHLRNRRMLAIVAFFFLIIWPFVILAAHLFFDMDVGAVSIFLGYAGTVGASPIVAYCLAAHKEDLNNAP